MEGDFHCMHVRKNSNHIIRPDWYNSNMIDTHCHNYKLLCIVFSVDYVQSVFFIVPIKCNLYKDVPDGRSV